MCIKPDFKKIFFKLATNGQSDKAFLLTSKFRYKGLSALPWGCIRGLSPKFVDNAWNVAR